MVEKESLFLNREEAVEAVCRDFRQYPPQIRVFCQIIRLISRGHIVTKREVQKNGAWISVPGSQNMRWMDGPEMVEYVCESLKARAPSVELLASICARVFHTRASTAVDAETGKEGVRIETGMEDFVCQQCGQCCLSLDYHKEITAEDVDRWEALGRQDILDWVGVFKGPDGKTSYRIWTIPGTSDLSDVCPFLERRSWENRWVCRIHDAKPEICRQYPASRKHAEMTGCPGFKKGLG